jgi:hypothetical protein
MSEDESEKEVRAWIGSELVDSVADYAKRGREYSTLSDLELSSAWVRAFSGWAHDIQNREIRRKQADYGAEFILRGMEPPFDLVRDEQDLLRIGLTRWMDTLHIKDLEDFGNSMENDFNEFQAKRDKEQN